MIRVVRLLLTIWTSLTSLFHTLAHRSSLFLCHVRHPLTHLTALFGAHFTHTFTHLTALLWIHFTHLLHASLWTHFICRYQSVAILVEPLKRALKSLLPADGTVTVGVLTLKVGHRCRCELFERQIAIAINIQGVKAGLRLRLALSMPLTVAGVLSRHLKGTSGAKCSQCDQIISFTHDKSPILAQPVYACLHILIRAAGENPSRLFEISQKKSTINLSRGGNGIRKDQREARMAGTESQDV